MRKLLLALLAAGSLAQLADPTAQLVSTLNTASLQLQALGTLTLNNNTFVQLVQVLNVVFGQMSTSVAPFYYTHMQGILKQNTELAQTLSVQFTSMNGVFNVLDGYIANMLTNYLGQLTTIESRLQTDYADFKAALDQTEAMARVQAEQFGLMAQDLQSAEATLPAIDAAVAGAINQLDALVAQAPVQLNVLQKSIENIELDNIVLAATALTYCRSLVYNYPRSYSPVIPKVGLAINLVGSGFGPGDAYDVVLAAQTSSTATIWICDRSYATFTPRPATLLVSVSL